MTAYASSHIREKYYTPETFFLYISIFFFFNDTATTEIYTLSLHDALPISTAAGCTGTAAGSGCRAGAWRGRCTHPRSEEHTSELQSQSNLVCRLLLEKKKTRLTLFAPDNLAQVRMSQSTLHDVMNHDRTYV